jgi:hypothetical protein
LNSKRLYIKKLIFSTSNFVINKSFVIGPIIHVLNKKEQAIANEKNVAWFKKIETKKNVILMGDSLHDVDMAEGVKDIKTCLRIGFLNDNVDELLEHYKKGKKNYYYSDRAEISALVVHIQI